MESTWPTECWLTTHAPSPSHSQMVDGRTMLDEGETSASNAYKLHNHIKNGWNFKGTMTNCGRGSVFFLHVFHEPLNIVNK